LAIERDPARDRACGLELDIAESGDQASRFPARCPARRRGGDAQQRLQVGDTIAARVQLDQEVALRWRSRKLERPGIAAQREQRGAEDLDACPGGGTPRVQHATGQHRFRRSAVAIACRSVGRRRRCTIRAVAEAWRGRATLATRAARAREEHQHDRPPLRGAHSRILHE
jgi:hypothetical protein